MEAIIFSGLLIVVVFIIVPVIQHSTTRSRINDLTGRISMLEKHILTLQDMLRKQQDIRQTETKQQQIFQDAKDLHRQYSRPSATPEPETPPEPKPVVTPVPEPVIITKPPVSLPPLPTPEPALPKPIAAMEEKADDAAPQRVNYEKLIGENILNKIGIALLVLGIAFFVKYAIDHEWLNELGRTVLGIISGGIILGFAHYLRNSYKAFSSVLVGGGIAVLYFTITIAFQDYHLLGQTFAFIVVTLITAFSVLLSIWYDRKELAVLSMIGGFASPFMVSTGEGNYKVLFTYLLVLNLGMLVLAHKKKWEVIKILAFFFTVIIFGGWFMRIAFNSTPATFPLAGTIIFASLFYLVFFAMHILTHAVQGKSFGASQFGLLLLNTGLYYVAGYSALVKADMSTYHGLFTVAIAVFNLAAVLYFYKQQQIDRNFIYLLIGIVLTFVSLAAPVQLHGHNITLFWAAESVLLLWLSQKSGIKLIRLGSAAVAALTLFSLLVDFIIVYDFKQLHPLAVIFNKAFITGLFAFGCFRMSVWLLRRDESTEEIAGMPPQTYASALGIISVAVLYAAGFLELLYQFRSHGISVYAQSVMSGVFNAVFITVLWLLVTRRYEKDIPRLLYVPVSVFYAALLLIFIPEAEFLRRGIMTEASALHHEDIWYWMHLLAFCISLFMLYMVSSKVYRTYGHRSSYGNVMAWCGALICIWLLSAELYHVVAWFAGNNSWIGATTRVGLPILWGSVSLFIMITGMKRKIMQYRIIALVLFGITILKLFVYDIRNASEGGKILAFVLLGILLLVASFMYQKLKGLLLGDEEDTAS